MWKVVVILGMSGCVDGTVGGANFEPLTEAEFLEQIVGPWCDYDAGCAFGDPQYSSVEECREAQRDSWETAFGEPSCSYWPEGAGACVAEFEELAETCAQVRGSCFGVCAADL